MASLDYPPTKSNEEIHHDKISFKDLLNNFLKQEKLKMKDIEMYGDILKDENLANKWREYHKENAILKVVDKEIHKLIHRKNKKKLP